MIDDNLIRSDNEATKDIIFLPEYFKYQEYYTMGIGELFHHYAPEEWRNLISDPGYSKAIEEYRKLLPQVNSK